MAGLSETFHPPSRFGKSAHPLEKETHLPLSETPRLFLLCEQKKHAVYDNFMSLSFYKSKLLMNNIADALFC